MPIIKTKRNFVAAHDPLPEDCFVHVFLRGSEKRHLLSTDTIDHYREAVNWAVGIADAMDQPIEIVPVTGEEYLRRNRDGLERYLAGLTDQERGALRQDAIASMAQILRDSSDPKVRAEAYEVLKQLKVIL
jgi:hypothetical protein